MVLVYFKKQMIRRSPSQLTCSSFQTTALTVTSCNMSKPRDYSSQTYSPSGTGPAKSYPTADSKIDSSGKSSEKEDLVGLNDKFVRLIEKVCK